MPCLMYICTLTWNFLIKWLCFLANSLNFLYHNYLKPCFISLCVSLVCFALKALKLSQILLVGICTLHMSDLLVHCHLRMGHTKGKFVPFVILYRCTEMAIVYPYITAKTHIRYGLHRSTVWFC